jgi:hypothetical protein
MQSPPLISGPIPPYSNPPIQPQYYSPNIFFISGIELGINTIVTMTQNTTFVIGQLCRLLIPHANGSYQLTQQTGYVNAIPNPNQVQLDLNSTLASPFINTSKGSQPQIVAVGDINTGQIVSTGRIQPNLNIPGSFINISPI